MAIRFVDKPEGAARRAPSRAAATPGPGTDAGSDAQAAGAARFATPIEADAPVNPNPSGELPFSELPRVEKAERKKRATKPKAGASR